MEVKLELSLELLAVVEPNHMGTLGKRLRLLPSAQPRRTIDQESILRNKDLARVLKSQKWNCRSSKTETDLRRSQKTEKNPSKTSKLTVHKDIQFLLMKETQE